MNDQLAGLGLLLFSISVFVYYTLWVIVLPFVDSDHAVHSYFLPQEYAIALPVGALVLLLSFLLLFLGILMVRSRLGKKKKA
ncbi:dolichyl-phosphate mannosyltransferase polypeptide 2 regulatory subunit [Klebsormidium nitens]|uniref:Dolichol phosphate-mannose biosynthesis regulatory protein n=1 Tax=Klebsormidium nitens TaxID=105231 RepID=A0A1Y1IIY2_KLENI|nr:dolichyl-phosphate mannosyltransferase polypeptide 2 regulatory subunit [Klebsormidium nitens]|eukprot:GAQ90830.1 dolichyl-phosphate mannosyltransferase polypeptide 2 regulatory subunit [Klebsormidium nitens]